MCVLTAAPLAGAAPAAPEGTAHSAPNHGWYHKQTVKIYPYAHHKQVLTACVLTRPRIIFSGGIFSAAHCSSKPSTPGKLPYLLRGINISYIGPNTGVNRWIRMTCAFPGEGTQLLSRNLLAGACPLSSAAEPQVLLREVKGEAGNRPHLDV